MSDVNILLPKLLVQTLTQTPQPEFIRAEYTGSRVAPPGSGSAGEYQRPPLARPFPTFFSTDPLGETVLLKSEDSSFSKGERTDDVRGGRFLDLFVCDFEERFPDGVACVPYCYANVV